MIPLVPKDGNTAIRAGIFVLLVAVTNTLQTGSSDEAAAERTSAYWRDEALKDLKLKISRIPNEGKARNVVFFLGDGMGVASVAGGSILKAEQSGRTYSRNTKLQMERLPFSGLVKTHSIDGITPDSAATSTAYLCGVKTNNGMLGLLGSVPRGDCAASLEQQNQIDSVIKWAQANDMWTGIVTTDSVLGASPAGGYAHSAERKWYSSVPEGCAAKDIADQLLFGSVGSKMKVILGGGLQDFLPPSYPAEGEERIENLTAQNSTGVRKDERNLIREYLEANEKSRFVSTREQLLQVDPDSVDRLLGLFSKDALTFTLDRDPDFNTEPTIEEMTEIAIRILSNAPHGFFLFVEGGNIDTAHHSNKAKHSLEEVIQFDKAIELVANTVSFEDTLVLVTADHSHGVSISGYSSRAQSITGDSDSMDLENKTYRIISYPTGPGEDYPSLVKMTSGAHSAEDVPIYASGPWAHLFEGSIDNTLIPNIIAHAACIGPFQGGKCLRKKVE
ncbi:alkaline phosphatase, tissue-nonspecific isozyme [Galendromus occidentalis]|uniref:alkaline phosphatase n=1 Tax=Galendromus occidentalis TaxID=34638 RepID=A0AAJ6QX80_9ACAR|nr:alkaline phosphatase, tissue-nonspecific isozyme [Galendromus occidentalis]